VKPAPFDYHCPGELAEAIAILQSYGDEAKVLAGGQSLIPLLSLRLSRFDHLVDLQAIEDLRGVTAVDGSIRVGAMTTQAALARSEDAAAVPLLAKATSHIGHYQIRNRGTVGSGSGRRRVAGGRRAKRQQAHPGFGLLRVDLGDDHGAG
jgi:aerobic carbon-monoxide dehydrogenase medium subunit